MQRMGPGGAPAGSTMRLKPSWGSIEILGATVRKSSPASPREIASPKSLGPPSMRTLDTPSLSRSARRAVRSSIFPEGSGGRGIVRALPDMDPALPAVDDPGRRTTVRSGSGSRRFSRGTSPVEVIMTARGSGDLLPSEPRDILSARRVPAPTSTASAWERRTRMTSRSALPPILPALPEIAAPPSRVPTAFRNTKGRSPSRGFLSGSEISPYISGTLSQGGG